MAQSGGLSRHVADGLFVVGVAAFALGLLFVVAALGPTVMTRDARASLLPGSRHADSTASVRPGDPFGADADRHDPALGARFVPCQPVCPPPAPSPVSHAARQERSLLDDDGGWRAYLQDGANAARGYLAPRPNTNRAD